MKKPFDAQDGDFPAEMLKAARTAADMENPMAAEHFLCSYRLAFLDTLRPMDPFSAVSYTHLWRAAGMAFCRVF